MSIRLRSFYIVKALLTIAGLFVALAWAESFVRRDIVWIACPKGGAVVSSSAGKLQILLHKDHNAAWTTQHQAFPGEEPNRIDPRFQLHIFNTAIHATCPHWFLFLLFGLPFIFYKSVTRLTMSPESPTPPTSANSVRHRLQFVGQFCRFADGNHCAT